jgi:hypothetical protein
MHCESSAALNQQRTFAVSTKVFSWIYLGVKGQEERGAGWWVRVGGTGVSLNWRYNHKPCDHDPFPPPKKPLNPAKAQQSQGIEIACYKLSQKPITW